MSEYLVETKNLSWFWKTVLVMALILIGDFIGGLLLGLWLAGFWG